MDVEEQQYFAGHGMKSIDSVEDVEDDLDDESVYSGDLDEAVEDLEDAKTPQKLSTALMSPLHIPPEGHTVQVLPVIVSDC